MVPAASEKHWKHCPTCTCYPDSEPTKGLQVTEYHLGAPASSDQSTPYKPEESPQSEHASSSSQSPSPSVPVLRYLRSLHPQAPNPPSLHTLPPLCQQSGCSLLATGAGLPTRRLCVFLDDAMCPASQPLSRTSSRTGPDHAEGERALRSLSRMEHLMPPAHRESPESD